MESELLLGLSFLWQCLKDVEGGRNIGSGLLLGLPFLQQHLSGC
jgi:hypothetical protein